MRQLKKLPLFFRTALLLAEGHAVSALVLGGICLMGTNHDPVQGAIVLVLAMVGALADSAFDGFVGMAVHKKASFDFGFGSSMCRRSENRLEKCSNLAFCRRI